MVISNLKISLIGVLYDGSFSVVHPHGIQSEQTDPRLQVGLLSVPGQDDILLNCQLLSSGNKGCVMFTYLFINLIIDYFY